MHNLSYNTAFQVEQRTSTSANKLTRGNLIQNCARCPVIFQHIDWKDKQDVFLGLQAPKQDFQQQKQIDKSLQSTKNQYQTYEMSKFLQI